MHVPSLFHAVALQTHVNAGSLKAESVPLHPLQTVSLMHPVQLLLHAKFKIKIKCFINICNNL
jgi:hypothetical protein